MPTASGRWSSLWKWGIALVVVSVLLFVLGPIYRERMSRPKCMKNMHQLGQALSLYVSDNDGVWPNEAAWRDRRISTQPVSGCPLVKDIGKPGIPGYAYNYALRNNVASSRIAFPSSTIAVCEEPVEIAFTYTVNPYQSYPQDEIAIDRGWERHAGGGHYLLCDGHVEWLRLEQVAKSDQTEMGNGGVQPSFAIGSVDQVRETMKRLSTTP